ncbi:trehalose-phosphatase [Xanthobacteraceae bacterium Astr-EGSB]|uniref:trehalose-phosphatase n=1 Tax=Astrobacterium formosum TaxID=3069710 RepID=UPI0027B8551F|nr:trehalose-phosphatase [Xanthobacteraceae bacterium Astr-EGSB]
MTNVLPPGEIILGETALLLDIDGTLLNFAPTPREVVVPPTLRDTLQRLWEKTGGAVALVSGRSLDDIALLFAPLELPAIGGHGAEFCPFPGGDSEVIRLGPLDPTVKRKLATVRDIGPGILLEDKTHSLAIHYRLAPDKERAVLETVRTICGDFPDGMLELLPGNKVIEVKQSGFDKGTAVRELMRYAPFRGRRPIFIGDDVTDERVFPVLPEFGGFGFSVGRRVDGVVGYFDTPADVRWWLEVVSRERRPKVADSPSAA